MNDRCNKDQREQMVETPRPQGKQEQMGETPRANKWTTVYMARVKGKQVDMTVYMARVNKQTTVYMARVKGKQVDDSIRGKGKQINE